MLNVIDSLPMPYTSLISTWDCYALFQNLVYKKRVENSFFHRFFFGYSAPVTSYSLRGLLFFCNSYWDLLSVTVFNIISYEIMAKYFQNFAKGILFSLKEGCFFLPRNGVISSDNGG